MSTVTKPEPEVNSDFIWPNGRHLEKSIWRHNSATVYPIITRFGRQI